MSTTKGAERRNAAPVEGAEAPVNAERALAELRAVGSVELMLRRCTQVVCERCGFDQSIMYRIDGNRVFPASAFDRQDADWEAKVKHFAEKIESPVLDEMLLETDMLRR